MGRAAASASKDAREWMSRAEAHGAMADAERAGTAATDATEAAAAAHSDRAARCIVECLLSRWQLLLGATHVDQSNWSEL